VEAIRPKAEDELSKSENKIGSTLLNFPSFHMSIKIKQTEFSAGEGERFVS